MTKLDPRKALLLALVFAAAVVILSTIGPGLGALLFTILPLTVLYFVVRWAVVAGMRDAGGDFSTRTAREILDARYARGEIGPEVYGRMRSNFETP